MRLFAAFSLLGLTASPVVAERPTIEYLNLPGRRSKLAVASLLA